MIRLAVRCRPEQAEQVLAELVELVPGGVEEERGSGYVEYAIYGPPGELPELPDLQAAAGDGLVEIETTEIPDDWADRWRDFHEPVVIGGGRMVVRPSWEGERGTEIDIVVDPGRAFGTGGHATTRCCLELLLSLADRGLASGPLADWGTGSGVLAIAAAKLGWDPVAGCDHELPAVEAAAANAAANGVDVSVERTNLREAVPPSAATVTANLTAPLLIPLAERMAAGAIAVPERMVLSGLLGTERDRVAATYEAAALSVEVELADGDWAALLLAR
ncbi:MAG TPA: 50S ribosomal protein L11 methyltransferase [Solirubrobacterales bacterium]|jgi:ribosomal protein L11 methyltransferase|nr:50S ribosomal protein L11 methyltransferase [Solirubrobacterales bacterium]